MHRSHSLKQQAVQVLSYLNIVFIPALTRFQLSLVGACVNPADFSGIIPHQVILAV